MGFVVYFIVIVAIDFIVAIGGIVGIGFIVAIGFIVGIGGTCIPSVCRRRDTCVPGQTEKNTRNRLLSFVGKDIAFL